MSRCGPKVLAEGVGLQWPTAGAFGSLASSPRASSPRLDQGGSVKTLIRGFCFRTPDPSRLAFTLHSGFDRRRLAPPTGSANPTTPASAVGDRSPLFAPPTVPAGLRPLADAGVSHVPSAPTRPAARRWWSAYADDSGRSAFPLEPPSFAPEWWPAERASISLEDLAVVLRSIRASVALSGARRHA